MKKKESEKAIEARLRERVASVGGRAVKNGVTYLAGMPDRTLYLPGGLTILVELKSTGKRPTLIQTKRIEEFRAMGYRVEVIDSIEGVDRLIAEIKTKIEINKNAI